MATFPHRVRSNKASPDTSDIEVQLRLTPDLSAAPVAPEMSTDDRRTLARVWQGLQTPPEEVVADRVELERLDRAIVAARKDVYASRAQNASLRAELAQARIERFANPVVYSLGALAVAGVGAWLLQRRQMRMREEESAASAIPASPSAFPPAVEPSGHSEFVVSDLDSQANEEADLWIARAKVAVPAA